MIRPSAGILLTGALTGLLAGCSADLPPPGEPFAVPELIEPIVVNPGLGGDAPTHMPYLSSPMSFLSHGHLVAPSLRSANRRHSVWLFGPEGAFLTEFGREGQGPGEFRTISGLSVLGDTVEIGDSSLGRLTYWLPDTDEVWMAPWSLPRSAVQDAYGWSLRPPGTRTTGGTRLVESRGYRWTTSTTLYEYFPAVFRLEPTEADPVFLVSALTVQRSRRATVRGNVIRIFDGRSRQSDLVGVLRSGAGAYEIRLDHPPQSPRRPGSWSVTLYSPDGDTLKHRRYAWEFQERTGEWRKSHIRSLTNGDFPDSALDGVERAIRALGPSAMLVSPVEEAVSTQDGRLWIRRDQGPGVVEWIALDPDLNPEFRLHLPRWHGIGASLGGRLVVSGSDADGLQSVRLYRLPPLSR
jgi:hypothetical protein